MDEPTFRRLVKDYRALLDGRDLPGRVFSWSARLLLPFVKNNGEMTREVCATIAARTWVEAAALIALYDLRQPLERQLTDVLLGDGKSVLLAWDRKGRFSVLDNERLRLRDAEEEAAPATLPFPS